jgi:hypothetical protein
VPEDLIRVWIGHADKSATDLYSHIRSDIRFRKEVAERIGFWLLLASRIKTYLTDLESQKLTNWGSSRRTDESENPFHCFLAGKCASL